MQLRGIAKTFVPGRPVLAAVDLSVAAGEVHSLLGENGAGKSTLMNILMGLVRADAGSLELSGGAIDLSRYTPGRAAKHGLGMVHQHSALVPAMSVSENMAFGDPAGGFFFQPAERRRQLRDLAERFDLAVPLDRRADELSLGERQRAEILRALSRGARVLILDEPTAVLTPGETQRLFASLRRLTATGRAVIFISHKLAEVAAIADRVTVLRRGRVTARHDAGDLAAQALGRSMLGRDLEPLPRRSPAGPAAEPLFVIRGLSAPGLTAASRLRSIDLTVYGGEIVALTGIDGNGQRELEEVLAGVRPASAGGLWIRGERVAWDARALRGAGVAHLAGDRESSGLVAGLSIAENLILKGSYDDRRYFPGGWLDVAAARRNARAVTERYRIVPSDPDLDTAVLSGGNAQKLAVARELAGEPRVLVAVNPTRGLDVGSARFVHEQLLERRQAGAAVLLISSELDEALALADRVFALVRGEISAVPHGASRAEIGAILLGEAAP